MNEDRGKTVWSIDADASLQAVVDDPACPPLLRQALSGAIPWHMRNETPVRRALAAPRLAPQWVASLLALGATLVVDGEEMPLAVGRVGVKSSLGKRSSLASSEFPRPERGADEYIRAERSRPYTLMVRPGGLKWGEAHVARTPADEPIVAAVAVVEMDGDLVRMARLALTGAWPEAARLAQAAAQLVGGPLDDERIQAVAAAVEQEVTPKGDFLGSREYRRAMAGVLTRRALEAARHSERRFLTPFGMTGEVCHSERSEESPGEAKNPQEPEDE